MEPTLVDARAPSWVTWPASAGGLAGYFVVRTEDWLLVKNARAWQLIRDNPTSGLVRPCPGPPTPPLIGEIAWAARTLV